MKKLTIFTLAAATAFAAPQISHAQNATPVGTEGHFYIELKDAPLSDALEMIFKAAGAPSFSIDEGAKAINIAPITFQNIEWTRAVRLLANQNGFLLQRDPETAAWNVLPRPTAAAADAITGAITAPGTGLPANPFATGRRPRLNGTPPITRANPQAVPGLERTNPFATGGPVMGGTGGGRGQQGGNVAPGTPKNPDAVYRLLPVQHVWAGGIARLFGVQPFSSEDILSPAASGGGAGGRGGGGGNNGGGRGGNNRNGRNSGFGTVSSGRNNGGNNGGGFGGGGFGGGGFNNRNRNF